MGRASLPAEEAWAIQAVPEQDHIELPLWMTMQEEAAEEAEDAAQLHPVLVGRGRAGARLAQEFRREGHGGGGGGGGGGDDGGGGDGGGAYDDDGAGGDVGHGEGGEGHGDGDGGGDGDGDGDGADGDDGGGGGAAAAAAGAAPAAGAGGAGAGAGAAGAGDHPDDDVPLWRLVGDLHNQVRGHGRRESRGAGEQRTIQRLSQRARDHARQHPQEAAQEEQDRGPRQRQRRVHHCSNCNTTDHNVRRCPMPCGHCASATHKKHQCPRLGRAPDDAEDVDLE